MWCFKYSKQVIVYVTFMKVKQIFIVSNYLENCKIYYVSNQQNYSTACFKTWGN